MLFHVSSVIFDQDVVISAADVADAKWWFHQITGIELDVVAEPFELLTFEDTDCAIDAVDAWWGNYCDYASDNENISDGEFERVSNHMHRTYSAIYSRMNVLEALADDNG
jgi:hypothetical protein